MLGMILEGPSTKPVESKPLNQPPKLVERESSRASGPRMGRDFLLDAGWDMKRSEAFISSARTAREDSRGAYFGGCRSAYLERRHSGGFVGGLFGGLVCGLKEVTSLSGPAMFQLFHGHEI